ncbi:MAG: hypothetical protein R3F59_25125 [Myxococcota bacterium]
MTGDGALDLGGLRTALLDAPLTRVTGRLVQAVGPLLEAEVPGATVGSAWAVEPGVVCEVVGVQGAGGRC